MPKSKPVAGVAANLPTPLLYAADHGHAGGNVRAAGRCSECGLNYPLTGTVRHPCQTLGYNQDQDQDQDQDQVQVPPSSPPGPGCNGGAPTRVRALVVDPARHVQSDMNRLEAAHAAGDLEPVDVCLGPVPASAGPVMCAVAEHMRLRMGLRLAVGDDRPLPYATSEAVKAGLAKDKATASNAINALVRAGVLAHLGQLPPLRPGLDGTKLYAPPPEPKDPA